MKTTLLIIISAMLLTSCMTEKRCSKYFQEKDSVIYRETITYKDRIVMDTLKGDTIEKQVILETLKEHPVYITNDKAIAKLEMKNNQLTLALIEKDTIISRTLKDAEITISQVKEKYQSKVIRERYIPKFYRLTLWWAIISWILILGVTAFKIWKMLK